MINVGTLNDLPEPKKVKLTPRKGQINYTEDELLQNIETATAEILNSHSSTPKFPVEVFPDELRKIIEIFHTSSGFVPEYYYSALLSVTAMCIGNKYRIRAKSNFTQPAILYLLIVGKSGIGKSAPLKTMFSPYFDAQIEMIEQYTREKIEYDRAKMEAIQNKMEFKDEPPVNQQLFFEVATIEAIWEMQSLSRQGVALLDDELSGWLDAMGMYTSGKSPELAYWLKNFDNPALYTINRKGSRQIIYDSCANIFGGMQPKILRKVAEGDRGATGLTARFIFTITDVEEVQTWSDDEPHPSIFKKYKEIISFMRKLPSHLPEGAATGKIERIDFWLSPGAKERYVTFYNSLVKRMNDEGEEKKFSQLSKFRGYCLRFALILEIMHFGAENYKNDTWNSIAKTDQVEMLKQHKIGLTAMVGAIALTEYYIATSMNVLGRLDNILNTYDIDTRAWYNNLPETFLSGDGLKIANGLEEKLGRKLKLGKTKIYTLYNDTKLFKRVSTGVLSKTILTG